MYRVMYARSGYYYVQQDRGSSWNSDWTRVSDFYRTRQQCHAFVRERKGHCHCRPAPRPTHVVEYL